MNAVLELFERYDVLELIYIKSENLLLEENGVFEPELSFNLRVDKNDYKKSEIILGIKIGDENLDTLDFYVSVSVVGYFSVSEADTNLTEDFVMELYKVNATAILFPYLRSLVSEITSKGDSSPIILPPINVQALMDQNN